MHIQNILRAGKPMDQAKKALILVHGRGGSAEDILSLAAYFPVEDWALLAPQATNNTWYPYSFLVPPKQNEPGLTSALKLLSEVEQELNDGGISAENIYLLGFSQGACLTLEYVARNARRRGGVVAFTGGLIGDKLYAENYGGDFAGTPMFIGTSDPDPHVPVERVQATTTLLKQVNAAVTEKVYKNMGHTISQDEINQATQLVFTLRG